MKTRTKVKAVAYKANAAGKFKANIEPYQILDKKELVERWAAYSGLNLSRAEAVLTMLEGFVMDELSKGNRLDFELVSFYPRLSAALPARDSSPDAEGLFVRGAVKARRPLVNGLMNELEAVNDLSSVHSHIYNVFDKTENKFDVMAAGHVLSISGCDIPVDAAKEDEGVWIEKRTHKGFERIAKGRVVGYDLDMMNVVFDEAVPSGKHVIAVYTRCGNGEGYRVVRVSRKIRAL